MPGSSSRGAVLAALLLATSACGEYPTVGPGPGSSSGGASSSGGRSSSGGASSSGGRSSSGGASSSGGRSSSGGASSSGGTGPQECVGTGSKAEPLPLDLYVMLDQSGSMADYVGNAEKWDAVTGALLSFVEQPGLDGTSVGLQYFPLMGSSWTSCSAADYATPDVEIGPLSQTTAKIRTSIGNHEPEGNTPTSAALKGAIDHARAWASDAAHAKDAVAVVLATDGEPTECETRPDRIEAIAAAGLAETPSIRTFVIGVGDLKSNLDGIAKAGGTEAAIIVETTGDVNAQFLAALNKIRGSAVACTYLIPSPPEGQTLDFEQVSVRYKPGGGAAAVTFARAVDAAACGTLDAAWRYDDAKSPGQIVFCPKTCERVVADLAWEVEVVLGCKPPIAR